MCQRESESQEDKLNVIHFEVDTFAFDLLEEENRFLHKGHRQSLSPTPTHAQTFGGIMSLAAALQFVGSETLLLKSLWPLTRTPICIEIMLYVPACYECAWAYVRVMQYFPRMFIQVMKPI